MRVFDKAGMKSVSWSLAERGSIVIKRSGAEKEIKALIKVKKGNQSNSLRNLVTTTEKRSSGGQRYASLTSPSDLASPTVTIAIAIKNALDPTKTPGRVRTLRDMYPKEISALEVKHNARVVSYGTRYHAVRARFSGVCKCCDEPFGVGVDVAWVPRRGATHFEPCRKHWEDKHSAHLEDA